MTRVFVSGVLGLVAGGALTFGALALARQAWWPLALREVWAWLLLLVFLGLSLLEMPLMLIALRKLDARWRAWLNAAYVTTACLYAALFALLTNWPEATIVLAALALTRFVSALIVLGRA